MVQFKNRRSMAFVLASLLVFFFFFSSCGSDERPQAYQTTLVVPAATATVSDYDDLDEQPVYGDVQESVIQKSFGLGMFYGRSQNDLGVAGAFGRALLLESELDYDSFMLGYMLGYDNRHTLAQGVVIASPMDFYNGGYYQKHYNSYGARGVYYARTSNYKTFHSGVVSRVNTKKYVKNPQKFSSYSTSAQSKVEKRYKKAASRYEAQRLAAQKRTQQAKEKQKAANARSTHNKTFGDVKGQNKSQTASKDAKRTYGSVTRSKANSTSKANAKSKINPKPKPKPKKNVKTVRSASSTRSVVRRPSTTSRKKTNARSSSARSRSTSVRRSTSPKRRR